MPEWTPPRFERLSLAPLWIWLGITAAWMGLYTAYALAVLGPTTVWSVAFWRGWGLTSFQDALLVGYLPAALVWGQREARRTLEGLRPALRRPEMLPTLLREVHVFDVRRLRIVALVAAVGALLLGAYNVSQLRSDPELAASLLERLGLVASGAPVSVTGVVVWEILALLVVAVLLSLFVTAEIATPRRFSAIGERETRVELIDLAPLRPFTELGLGAAVRVVGVAVVASVGLLVVPEDIVVIIALVAAPAAGVLALVGPVRGVRRTLERERRDELEGLRSQIRGALEAGPESEAGRLADLLAYEARLDSINAWLYDSRTLVRFGIVLGAGMSTIGGALVERLLSAVLD